MQTPPLLDRLTSSLDELASLLDHIHKLPQTLRPLYLEKINAHKNKLLTLKHGLKPHNQPATQQQYHSVQVKINQLRQEIGQHLSVHTQSTHHKENTDPNHSRHSRHSRKNHDDAMRMIVEKNEEISALKQQLEEKEQLITLNFKDIRGLKEECSELTRENELLRFSVGELEEEVTSNRTLRMRVEDESLDMKLREQEREFALQNVSEEA